MTAFKYHLFILPAYLIPHLLLVMAFYYEWCCLFIWKIRTTTFKIKNDLNLNILYEFLEAIAITQNVTVLLKNHVHFYTVSDNR